jgi:hypothetical protein
MRIGPLAVAPGEIRKARPLQIEGAGTRRDKLSIMITETQQWMNLGIFVAGGAALFTLIIGKDIKQPLLRILTGTLISITVYFAALWTLAFSFSWIETLQFPVIFALFAVLLGVGAHIFKKKSKLRYGQLEVLVGALSAVGIANASSQSVFARSLSLAAAAYVVARGLNNWDEELQENGDRFGNRSIWEQVRTIFFEEV